MEDAELILLAWLRPAYFEKCLASWGRARGVEKLRGITVRLGRGPAENMMRQLVVDAQEDYPLPPIRVVLDDPEDALRPGPDRALGLEFQGAFARGAGFVMECDEDIVVSDDILEYAQYARTLSPDCVCFHNDLGQGWSRQWDDSNEPQDTVQVRGEFTSWCFGVTRESWKRLWEPEWDWDRTSGNHPAEHGWEWQMHRQANRDNLRMVIPDASRCVNIGEFGGTFSHPEQFSGTIAKSFRAHREKVDYRVRP